VYLQKVISRKTFFKDLFFIGVLKVSDENRRIRIRIRIHTKMSRIRNTDCKAMCEKCFLELVTADSVLERKDIMVELKGLLKVYSKFRGEDSDSLANVIQLLAECALILLTRYHPTVQYFTVLRTRSS
jgi:hypothetical protein